MTATNNSTASSRWHRIASPGTKHMAERSSMGTVWHCRYCWTWAISNRPSTRTISLPRLTASRNNTLIKCRRMVVYHSKPMPRIPNNNNISNSMAMWMRTCNHWAPAVTRSTYSASTWSTGQCSTCATCTTASTTCRPPCRSTLRFSSTTTPPRDGRAITSRPVSKQHTGCLGRSTLTYRGSGGSSCTSSESNGYFDHIKTYIYLET